VQRVGSLSITASESLCPAISFENKKGLAVSTAFKEYVLV